MTEVWTGGCLCGHVRYALDGPPEYAGCCFCADCRKASGSGFIPFMGYPAARVRITGKAFQHTATSFRGTPAVRNYCPLCGGLVFGGIVGQDEQHTIYAGTLDDASLFRPTMAIFNRDRPAWVALPPGVTLFETMPG